MDFNKQTLHSPTSKIRKMSLASIVRKTVRLIKQVPIDIATKPTVVYIAGKISEDDNYKEKFSAAQQYLGNQGYTVLNPALLPNEMPYMKYFPINQAMIDVSDALYFLSDWHRSNGAKSEMVYALDHDKQIWMQE